MHGEKPNPRYSPNQYRSHEYISQQHSSISLFDYWYFYLAFTARQDYFTHHEPSQSLGGVKTGRPREKTHDHPQAALGLSHMWHELGSNPQSWVDRAI